MLWCVGVLCMVLFVYVPAAAALRGVAIQRGRARAAYPAAAAAAAAFARHPTPLTAAAATALHGYTPWVPFHVTSLDLEINTVSAILCYINRPGYNSCQCWAVSTISRYVRRPGDTAANAVCEYAVLVSSISFYITGPYNTHHGCHCMLY